MDPDRERSDRARSEPAQRLRLPTRRRSTLEESWITPGLVDAHTHLIFGGWRQNELALKLHGAGYLDILAAGGGILSTMRATKAASEEQLEAKASAALDEMLRFGTTTAEAKSGYGLSTGEECKALRVIGNLQKHHVMDLAATFMGAHAVPETYRDNRQGYLELLCEEMLPAVQEQGIAEFCDVFCEKSVFSAEESRRILLTGRQYGCCPKSTRTRSKPSAAVSWQARSGPSRRSI